METVYVSAGLSLALGFVLGAIWQRQKSKVVALIHEAKFRAGQIKALEKANADMEQTTRALSAKEFELVNANRRLRGLEDAKSKFISVTAHQLRTPLSGIKWTFNMLQTGQLGPIADEQKEFIDKGAESVQKMIKIINDLLNIDLDGNNRDTYHFEPTDLVALTEEVAAEFFSQAGSKKIALTVQKPAGDLPPVFADRGKIKITLENLVDNAIKYTPTGGQVTVSLSDKNLNTSHASLEVSVRDSGIGIVDSDKSKIFQKFFRSAQAISVEPDGSGLGLHIVKDIVEKHQGSVWFESVAGQGATFHLALPLTRKEV